MKPIMIIDGMNLLVRHYCANPAMDSNGENIGGIIGFIKSMTALVKTNLPSKVIVVWESGGSQRRRSIYPEYKKGRKPPKTNRTYGDAIPDTEENRIYQISTLTKLLKSLPVCQVYVQNCEADDIIAYLCNEIYKNDNKIIVSSDKDFYQLLNEKTRIYSPGKKIFHTQESVTAEFNISPNNFVIARSFDGDKSDNINGVENVGLTIMAKKFNLNGDNISIDEIINISKEEISKTKKPLKLYENIVKSEDIIKRNYKLMKLNASMLSLDQIGKVNDIINDYVPYCNKIKFLKKYIKYNISGIDCDNVCTSLYYLAYKSEKKEEKTDVQEELKD